MQTSRPIRSEFIANAEQASHIAARAGALARESTRKEWREVLCERDERRATRRQQRLAHPRNQFGRVPVGVVALVAAVAAVVTSYFGG